MVGLQTVAGTTSRVPVLMVQSEAVPVASHPTEHYRLYFVERGHCAASLDNWQLSLMPGDVVMASPTEVFAASAQIDCRSVSFHHDFFCVRVNRDEVYCDGVVFNRVSGLPRVAIPRGEWQILTSKFDELDDIVRASGVFAQDRSISTLRSMLLQIAEQKLKQLGVGATDPEVVRPLSDLALKFQHLLEATFVQHPGVGFFCDELGVTANTLNRRLKSELGQTVSQAVNERLAIQARLELRSGDKSVKQVAIELGFDDPLYFSRFFKKQFGYSPLHYFSQQDS